MERGVNLSLVYILVQSVFINHYHRHHWLSLPVLWFLLLIISMMIMSRTAEVTRDGIFWMELRRQ
jgi:uncharacterized membrane protein